MNKTQTTNGQEGIGPNVSAQPPAVAATETSNNSAALAATDGCAAAPCSARAQNRGFSILGSVIKDMGSRKYPLDLKTVKTVDIKSAAKYLNSKQDEWVIIGANVVLGKL